MQEPHWGTSHRTSHDPNEDKGARDDKPHERERHIKRALCFPYRFGFCLSFAVNIDAMFHTCAAALPHMGFAEGVLAGAPARAYRISFSGEASYEIAVPASFGAAVWEKLHGN